MTASPRSDQLEVSRLRQACSNCSLRDLCIPLGLQHGDMQKLDELVEKSPTLKGGDHLFRTDEPMRSIYAVRSGTLKSYVLAEDGEEQVLGFHLPGELVGLDAIHPGRHQCSVMALDTATACILPFAELTELATRVPDLQRQIMRLMSKEISSLVPVAGDHSAESRVAMLLLSLSRRFGERGYSPRVFRLAMPRRDIANYLRLATETVSRVLRRFQDDGLIEVERREVSLIDLEALRRNAGEKSSPA